MMIERYMTSEKWFEENPGKIVLDMFEWKNITVIHNDNVYEMNVPKHYSENVCKSIIKLYGSFSYTISLSACIHSAVFNYCTKLIDNKLITLEESVILYDELAYALANQMWAPDMQSSIYTEIKSMIVLK